MAIKINGTNSNSAVGLNNGDEDSGIKPGSNQVEIVTGGTTRVTVDNTNTTLSNNLSATTATFSGLVTGGNSAFLSGASSNGNLNIRNDGDGTAPVYEGYKDSFNVSDRRFVIFADGSTEVYTGTGTTGKNAGQEAFRVGNGAGNYRFSVYPDGTTVIGGAGTVTSNNIQLTNDGIIKVASGGGIHFHDYDAGATIDSNLLDDYEEGTWTPVPRFGGTSHVLTGTFNGNYTKIGNTVELRFRLTFSAKGTSTGVFTVEGVPFAAVDSFLWNNTGFGFLHRTNLPQSAGQVTSDVQGNVIRFRLAGLNGGNSPQMDDADLVNTSDIRGSITYRVST